jgi:hypothetical protein
MTKAPKSVNRTNGRRRYLRSTICLLLSGFFIGTAAVKAEDLSPCANNAAYYAATGNYKVGKVITTDPLSFMKGVENAAPADVDGVFGAGRIFTVTGLKAGRAVVQEKLEEGDDGSQRLQIYVVIGSVANCVDPAGGAKGSLDVVYKVVTTNYNSYLSHTWEFKKKQTENVVDSEIAEDTPEDNTTRLKVTPFISYNRTRRLYGGARVSLELPGNLVKKISFGGSGSEKGQEEEFNLTGNRSFKASALGYLEYVVSYKHSDLLSDTNRLRAGTLQFQLNAATKPLGATGFIIRYGAAIEGGNRQSNLVIPASNQDSVASSAYGGLKTYVGSTFVKGTWSLTGSYGLQLGTQGFSSKIEFAKHVGNLAFSKRWIPEPDKDGGVHKVTTLDIRTAGGIIQTFGRIPVPERFFGGNSPQSFIENNDWEILSAPLIRSLPQNTLNSGATIGAIGGTKFYSANVTIARPVWGRPILFKEIITDPDFSFAMTSSIESAQNILATYHAAELGLYKTLAAKIINDNLNPNNRSLKTEINELFAILKDPQQVPDKIPGATQTYSTQKRLLRESVFIIRKTLSDEEKIATTIEALLSNCDTNIADCTGGFAQVAESTKIFAATFKVYQITVTDPAESQRFLNAINEMLRLAGNLERKQQELLTDFNAVDTGAADTLARNELKDVRMAIDAMTKELNLYSISPVGMFDVARIFPDNFGTRFGAGPGIRFSIANFNATFGYVFNLNRKPGEKTGAFTFNFGVSDIFR